MRIRQANLFYAVAAAIICIGFSHLAVRSVLAQQAEAKETETKAEKQEKKADTKAETPKAVPKNPLTDLIKNIFGGKKGKPNGQILPGNKPAGDTTDESKEDESLRKSMRDHIDARAPYNTRHATILRHVDSLMAEEDWGQALELLSVLLNPDGELEDSVIRSKGSVWESARRAALRRISQFPKESLDDFRLQFGGRAAQMLQQARREGKVDQYVDVADRFFHTKAGYEAANYLAARHFDRGEYELSAGWYAQLAAANTPITTEAKWRLKAALAFRLAEYQGNDEPWWDKFHQETVALEVELAGRPVLSSAWVKEQEAKLQRNPEKDLAEEWLMPYGNASRTAVSRGGTPLLVPRWHVPVTRFQQLQEKMRLLTEDLVDQGRAVIPAFLPVMVNGRIVTRTLYGAQVLDAQTGRSEWHTDEGISAERILAGDRLVERDGQILWQPGNNPLMAAHHSSTADGHRLTSLMFRDGVYGGLSSDGDRLFVIEDQAILTNNRAGHNRSLVNQDPYLRDWSSNKLTAYDLGNGRPLWRVGGPAMGELFDPPLAGTYFLGAPLPDGDELFIIGERDNEIRLYSLDRFTGRELWSQLIGYSDTSIDQDTIRRFWTAQVSIRNGLIVCPTTVGWLVAVDRTRRGIAWAYRYSRPTTNKNSRRQTAVVQPTPLNTRWTPSAPIIVGNYVLYSPSESSEAESPQNSRLVCLNFLDGSRLWHKPKGTFLYVAGVFDDRVILVGTDSVTALAIDSGTTVWTTSIPKSEGRPCGRGVAVGDVYHLPLFGGQLWTLQLSNGRLVQKAFLSEEQPALGNLGMYEGVLVSVSAEGVTAFEQRESIKAEILARKKQNPDDAWAIVREAEMEILERKYGDALQMLRQVNTDALKKETFPQYRKAMLASLAAVIGAQPKTSEKELSEFQELATTDRTRFQHQRLLVEHYFAREQYAKAFDVLWELMSERPSKFLQRRENTRVFVSLDAWLSGQFQRVWHSSSQEEQEKIRASIDDALSQNDGAKIPRLLNIFGFLPQVSKRSLEIAQNDAKTGNFASAEHRLLNLSTHDDVAISGAAAAELALLYNASHLDDVAKKWADKLTSEFADVPVAGDKTGLEFVADLEFVETEPVETDEQWQEEDQEWVLERTGSSYYGAYAKELATGAGRSTFFERHRFQYRQDQRRLFITNVAGGTPYWSPPLRMMQGTTHPSNQPPHTEVFGHQLIVAHGGVLHRLSPIDRRLVWTHAVEQSTGLASYSNNSKQRATTQLVTSSSFISQSNVTRRAYANSLLAVANANYVCHRGRREIRVLDSTSGDVRWYMNGVPLGTAVLGTEELVFLIPPAGSPVTVLRASDGEKAEIAIDAGLISKTVYFVGNDFVTLESAGSQSILGLKKPDLLLKRIDPKTGTVHWETKLPSDGYLALQEPGHIVTLLQSGKLQLIELNTGAVRDVGQIDVADLKGKSQRYVVRDHANLYLILNGSSSRVYSENLPSVRVNGMLYCFSNDDTKVVWKQQVKSQNLILEQMGHSPILLFSARTYIRKGKVGYSSTTLLAIDKKSGRKLLEQKLPVNYGFQGLSINLREHYVELRSYNERVRLFAEAKADKAENEAASAETAAP